MAAIHVRKLYNYVLIVLITSFVFSIILSPSASIRKDVMRRGQDYMFSFGNIEEDVYTHHRNAIRILSFWYNILKDETNVKDICNFTFDCVVTHNGYKRIDHPKYYTALMVFGVHAMSRFKNYIRSHRLWSRDPNQIWIARGLESAISNLDYNEHTPFRNFFNWSVSLSHKATIYESYVAVQKLETQIPMSKIKENYRNLNKDKSFCWMVSQCNVYNDRFKLGSEIINELPEKIHMWGKASQTCMKSANQGQIINHGRNERSETHTIIQKCKFYFSFENSNCSDYVTEKFPNAIINYAIPIVNGWRESYEQMLPGSFIHVSDFKSVQHLTSHLKYLLGNETAYFEYFRWRQHYSATLYDLNEEYFLQPYCQVCEKLNSTLENRKRGIEKIETIDDLGTTFSNLQQCVKPI